MMKFLKKISNRVKYFNRISNSESTLNENTRKIIEKLKVDGYVKLDGFLNPEQVQKFKQVINREIEDNLNFEFPCIAQTKIEEESHSDLINNYFLFSDLELEKRGITFSKSEIDKYPETIEKFKPSTLKLNLPNDSSFMDLWLNTSLLEIIEGYMQMKPYLMEAYLRRNFPAKYKVMNHFWHRDRNHEDFLLKIFFFFSDCSLENGPHEYIAGSIKDRRLDGKPYYSDSQVDSLYPEGSKERIVSVVRAGTVIIEDTRGLHRARVPNSGYRDLGYAVFLPVPFYQRIKERYFTYTEEQIDSLSEYQRSFLPPSFKV